MPMWVWIATAMAVWLIAFFLFEIVQKLSLVALFLIVACYLASTIDWHSALTPLSVLKLLGIVFCASNLFWLLRHWWHIWNGLDQWPTPKGRYYQRWYDLPHEKTKYDYYEWLAREKGWAEPWNTWAQMERELNKKA